MHAIDEYIWNGLQSCLALEAHLDLGSVGALIELDQAKVDSLLLKQALGRGAVRAPSFREDHNFVFRNQALYFVTCCRAITVHSIFQDAASHYWNRVILRRGRHTVSLGVQQVLHAGG